MIYDIRHVTAYAYDAAVGSARCGLRLTPADGGGQARLDHRLTLSPVPARTAERTGFFGARVTEVAIDTPHRDLRIEARSRVRVTRRAPAEPGPAWEAVREAALAGRSLAPDAPVQHLFPTPLTPASPAVTAYAAASFPAGRPIGEGALDLARRLKADFAYDPGATLVSTPLADAFARRRGVCQDFAHIMIAGLRGLGLPAAYVSGYIHTRPPPGRARLQGADATHAWVSVWAGPALGWVGYDPTNALVVADEHILLAVGRDYADISPVDGIILGSGGQRLSVAVDVVPAAA